MYARAKTREYPIDMAQIKNVWWKIAINNTTSPTTTPNTLITGVCVLFIYLFFNLGEKTNQFKHICMPFYCLVKRFI